MVGVPLRNIEQWRIFAGGLAKECPAEHACVLGWLDAHKMLPASEAQMGAPEARSRSLVAAGHLVDAGFLTKVVKVMSEAK